MKPFLCPQPGRRILHLDCSQLQSHSIEEATLLLLELGFTPDVAYRLKDGKLGLILVLANEPFDHDFGAAFDLIADRFDPDCECLHATGWPQSVSLPNVVSIAA